MDQFISAVIVAVAGIFVTAVFQSVRILADMRREVKSLGPSMQALYAIQPHIIRATRFQNAALKELGANGSTIKSDECLDVAEAHLDRRLTERVGGCA
jgi:hypothetical protein